jgi:hypothetical protein
MSMDAGPSVLQIEFYIRLMLQGSAARWATPVIHLPSVILQIAVNNLAGAQHILYVRVHVATATLFPCDLVITKIRSPLLVRSSSTR